MNEYRTLALDLMGRFADIDRAIALTKGLFNRDMVAAVRDFAMEAQRQRGGSILQQSSSLSPQQLADDFTMSVSRIDNLTNKLRRGRFARDPLTLAGLSIRAALTE